VVIAAAAVLAGCSSADDRSAADVDVERALIALPAIDHADGIAREPMIVEAKDGTLFLTGYGETYPTLWRSTDGGASWSSVDVGGEADGAVGNSDVDLAISPDGTLHFIVMSFDRVVGEGRAIVVGSSGDSGSTWTWSSLSRDRFDDRPWIEVDSNGVAHAIWNDGSGVSHATSTNGGATWTEQPRIHPSAGSSHLAVGPAGRIAVRLTPLSASGHRIDPDIDRIAVSIDGGVDWVLRDLPGTRAWTTSFNPDDGVMRWVEPVAWDATGALYALWSEGKTLRLARSADDGASWRDWTVVTDTAELFFPYLVARGGGELAATWFIGRGESLRANVAYIALGGGADEPRVVAGEPYMFPAFRQANDSTPPVREPAGEYFPALFLRDGRLAVVSTIQDPASDRWGFTFRPYRIEDLRPEPR
jgi:hypothetical protein